MAPTNKTLYLGEDDAAVWDRARVLADDKLRPVVMAALRRFVADQEAQLKMVERIVIRYADKASEGRPTAKAFYGRWLITPEDPHPASRPLVAPMSAPLTAPNFFTNLAGAKKSSDEPIPALTPPRNLLSNPYLEKPADQPTNRYPPLSSLAGISISHTDIPALRPTLLKKGFAVAVSAKGSVVLYLFEGNPDLPSGWVWTYPSFDEAIDAQEPGSFALSALHEALNRQGVPVEELDI